MSRPIQAVRFNGLTGQIRQLIPGPLDLVASIEDVARHIAIAPRTLRRKLEEEGASVPDVVEAERRKPAVQLLQGTQMEVDEIALQLSYCDSASFTRAFRRWFRPAPGEY